LVVDPIVQLAKTWRQGSAGTRLNAHLRAWSAEEPSLVRFAGSAERLFRFLRSEPSAERDRVFCALLRQARQEEHAGLVLLEALLPGLKALLGRILVDARESDELLAMLLKNAWEQIATYPLERRPHRVAANLLLDIRKQTLRELGHQRRFASERPVTRPEAATVFGSDIEAPLRRAVTAGALTADEAELVLQSRVDRRPLAQLAAELGLAYVTVYKRRAKAEQRLLLFLGQPGKNRGPNRHMSSARTVRLSGAVSASGGAVTDKTSRR
jgi:DNA-directed RNA polymerase specialized sigma24 family protein